jgi:hypothetical protein
LVNPPFANTAGGYCPGSKLSVGMRFPLGGSIDPHHRHVQCDSNLVIGSVAGDPLPCPKRLKGLIPADDMPALNRTFGWLSFGFTAPNLMDRRRSRSKSLGRPAPETIRSPGPEVDRIRSGPIAKIVREVVGKWGPYPRHLLNYLGG